jgi:membrane protease YdiL (CAAX protease family)
MKDKPLSTILGIIAPGFGDPPPVPLASRRHTVRFLLIAVGIAIATFLQAQRASTAQPASRLPLYASLVAIELLFVWFVRLGVRARGGRLRDVIGRRWQSAGDMVRDALLGITFVVAITFCTRLLFSLLGRWPSNTAWLLPDNFADRAVWVIVATAAGVCEEFVYRGYLQRQLWSWSGSLSAAILLQAIIFGTGHIYQGWKPALVTAIYGLAFGLLAAWRRSVLPGMIAHSLIDIIGGLVRH